MCSYMSSIKNQERHSTLFNSRIPSYSRRLHGLETRSQGPLRHSRPSRSLLFHFCHTAPLTASERVNSFSRLHGLETRSQGPLRHSRPSGSLLFHFCHTTPPTGARIAPLVDHTVWRREAQIREASDNSVVVSFGIGVRARTSQP